MGIKKFLARKGTVGSTARWAAKGFFYFKSINPSATLDDVMRFLVASRYGNETSGIGKSFLRLIDDGQIMGLAHLSTAILIAEAGFSDNTHSDQSMFRDVIYEELERHQVPLDFIHTIK